MRTPSTTFRLDPEVLEKMELLITDPPPMIFDAKRGGPRTRTELIEVLVKRAFDEQGQLKKERKKKA